MAGYDVSVGRDLLPGLLSGQDGLAKLVEAVLNQVLEAQVTESLGAGSARTVGSAPGLSQRLPSPHAVYPRRAGDAASAADAGRQLLH